ncbi:MAG: lysylphosphatidylglycerol synthase domain-containing protein, partial [Bacteroidales bacterium]|nr:lysylphosphatidylglycerol synthase domain-containing protein [Bacteroidales bacterium]
MKHTAKVSKYLNIAFNMCILIVSVLYILTVFENKKLDFTELLDTISNFSSSHIWIILSLLLTFMILNWALETMKWKLLVSPIYQISFFSAFKSVLLGVFTGLFMPNRTGEWIGRIFSVPNAQKGALFVHTMIGNVAQLLVTILMGTVAIFYFVDLRTLLLEQFSEINNILGLQISWWLILIVLFFLLTLFLVLFLNKKTKSIKRSFIHMKNIPLKNYFNIFGISILRYGVFTIQYLVLFYAFTINTPLLDLFLLISLYFMVLAIIPSVVFTEVGIRGSISLFIFGLYGSLNHMNASLMNTKVVFVMLIVWLINVILPAIV